MIETNMSMVMNQERRPDGTIRLTTFIDVVYDNEGAVHVAPLMASVMALGKTLCKHPKWEWKGGRRYCKGCNKELPGRQSPSLDVAGNTTCDSCGLATALSEVSGRYLCDICAEKPNA